MSQTKRQTCPESKCPPLQNLQVCPTDTDIYYDARNDVCGPTECCPIPTPNRTRPTQNDRDRDHSNLSNQPNTEACAGQTQPPAGRNSNRHAKDNNDTCYDNNDRSDDDEKDEDECEDDSKDGHTFGCRTTFNGVFTDHCDGSCTRHQTDEDAKPTEPQSTVKFLAKCCKLTRLEGVGDLKESSNEDICNSKDRRTASAKTATRQQSKQAHDEVETKEDEPLNSAQLTEVQLMECSRGPPLAAACSDEGSQTTEDCRRIEEASNSETEVIGCMPQSLSKTLQATHCGDAKTSPLELQGAGKPPAELDAPVTTSFPPPSTHSETTVEDTHETASDQIVPLLQSIYEVLQSIRDEKTTTRTPSTTQTALQHSIPSVEELCHVTEFPLTTEEPAIDTMAILEPPERDTDVHCDRTSFSRSRRFIPVDMDLLRTEDNIDWEMQPTLSSNQLDPQPDHDDLTRAANEAEAFHKSSECLNKSDTPTMAQKNVNTPNTTQFIHCPHEKPHGREKDSKKARSAVENSKRTRSILKIASDSPSDKSIVNIGVTLKDTLKHSTGPQPAEIDEERRQNLGNIRFPTSKSDVGTDRPNLAVCTNRQADINNLEAMQATRSNVKYHFSSTSSCHGRWRAASADLSFPASIEKVHELGRNSLFVKWTVHSLKNVAGYEIFLDGTLTNRYYSQIHRAAVICNVDLAYPHRIILRALPPAPKRFSSSSKSRITSQVGPLATTTPDNTCCSKTNDTTTWYPSVYHFEPTLPPATVSFDYNGCCASQS